MLTKVARCTLVSVNEGARTFASTIGVIVNTASQSSVRPDQLHFDQLHRYGKQNYYN